MNEQNGTKENILARALELFAAKGYEAVSVQELVDAAQITKPTLYYHFGSKEGLYEAVAAEHYARLDAMLQEAARYVPRPDAYFADIYPVLLRLTESWFAFALGNENFYRLALTNLALPATATLYPIAQKYQFRQFAIVAELFEQIAQTHHNLKGKAELLAWVYTGMVNSFISLHYNRGANLRPDAETAQKLVRQFMHGIHS